MTKKKEKEKPRLCLVQFSPVSKPRVGSLIDRLSDVIQDYLEEETKHHRIVTRAEVVGVIEFLKDRFK